MYVCAYVCREVYCHSMGFQAYFAVGKLRVPTDGLVGGEHIGLSLRGCHGHISVFKTKQYLV